MPLAMEQDEPTNPAHIRLFRAHTVVARAQARSHLVQQARRRGRNSAGLSEVRSDKGDDRRRPAAVSDTVLHGAPPCECRARGENNNEPSASAVPDEFLAPTLVRGGATE